MSESHETSSVVQESTKRRPDHVGKDGPGSSGPAPGELVEKITRLDYGRTAPLMKSWVYSLPWRKWRPSC